MNNTLTMNNTLRRGGRSKFTANIPLKNFREALHLSQAKLAELAGCGQSDIAKLETGERRTTADWAVRLAPHLGREPRDLFPQAPSSGHRRAEGEVDHDVMTRAVDVARRLAGPDDALLTEIVAPVYALLIREREGFPITDDERTLSILENFIRRLKRRGRPEPPERK